MTPPKARIAAVLALFAAAAAASWWWMQPERQIRAILDDVAAAFTHDREDSGLEALTAVAALQKHLALDVSIQTGDSTRIEGREAVITAAARVRSASSWMRLRFFDPQITFAGDREATVSATAEVTVKTESGEDLVDVHRVTATVYKLDDRWVVSRARRASIRERES